MSGRMTSFALVLLAFGFFSATASGGEAPVSPEDFRLAITVEPPAAVAAAPGNTGQPYEQEMLFVRVHGIYRLQIALESLEQPALPGFAWTQLGHDSWTEVMVDGSPARAFDRTMAIYPVTAGSGRIEPFVHHLTVFGRDGQRYRQDIVSNAAETKALSHPPVPDASGWWLPASRVTLTDELDRSDPLKYGETLHRTVTLEAAGVGPEMLPPAPVVGSSGTLAFADPEQRSLRLTPDGPVSRVVWRWTLRPLDPDASRTVGFSIPWFDTTTRQFRHAVAGDHALAMVKAEARPGDGWPGRYGAEVPVLAFALGLGLGLWPLLHGRRWSGRERVDRWTRQLLPDPARRAIGAALRCEDVQALRQAGLRLVACWQARGEHDRSRRLEEELRVLDRDLFAGAGRGLDWRRLRLALRGLF